MKVLRQARLKAGLLSGIILLMVPLYQAYKSLHARWTYPRAPATVVASSVVETKRFTTDRGEVRVYFGPKVEFTFVSDGKLEKGTKWSLFDPLELDRPEAEACLKKLTTGTSMVCWYPRGRAADAVLDLSPSLAVPFGLAGMALIVVFGGILYLRRNE